ncbi:hypothetical protein RYX36_012388 [Vicia faba]
MSFPPPAQILKHKVSLKLAKQSNSTWFVHVGKSLIVSLIVHLRVQQLSYELLSRLLEDVIIVRKEVARLSNKESNLQSTVEVQSDNIMGVQEDVIIVRKKVAELSNEQSKILSAVQVQSDAIMGIKEDITMVRKEVAELVDKIAVQKG